MTLTALRLVAGARVLELTPDNGYSRTSLEVGLPAVRAESSPRAGRDGEDDTTSLHGAAAVTLALTLTPSRGRPLTRLLDDLRSFLHPAARPFLVVERDGEQRRVRLRADTLSAPLEDPTHQRVQVAWRAPDGVMEALAEQVGVANAVQDAEAGIRFDITFPWTFPASSAAGSVTVVNPGTVAVRPLLRLHGPYTDPRVESQTTGQRLIFTGLSVAAGDWLEIDCRESTVRLNGLREQSRYSRLDFMASEFLALVPGINTLRFFPVSFAAGARLEALYRPAWI